MTPGEEVTVSDGQGMDYFCRIAELTKEEVRLDIVDSWHSFVELPAKIYLFQGLPKADKMELIIQKAVELGVYEIVPVATKRAVVKLDPKKEEKKRLRWQSIAESAAKQAGRALIPQIATCISFEKALRMCNGLNVCHGGHVPDHGHAAYPLLSRKESMLHPIRCTSEVLSQN